MLGLLKRWVGSRSQRLIGQKQRRLKQIAALEKPFAALSDAALRAKTDEFRARLGRGESLDSLMPEAFATVREAAGRVLGMRHFEVQLIGGMLLHDGRITEMKTGEGKTLVATLTAYLNALPGQGVHVVTVNDYLARRDAEWMGQIYGFLGLTTGAIVSGLTPEERRRAYAADITYGTNAEFGFDYLRDNLVSSLDQKVQRPLHYAIVDEVDSILIDEARTPLVISAPASGTGELYRKINGIVPRLRRRPAEGEAGDFWLDEKARQAHLTEAGHHHLERLLVQQGLLPAGANLYDAEHIHLLHYLQAGLKAHTLFQRDVDYVVTEGQVVIVDEFTGRAMEGRRWSEGLHQAVEAKEGVRVQDENRTLASITYQNFFRLYTKLAGMTGTADTEAGELLHIYGLEVVVVPPNRPVQRRDEPDRIYLTAADKYTAVIADIRDCVERGQPVLVGTTSIESSEHLSARLKKAGLAHKVLNAKYHDKEARIIAEAGQPGAVTIATNMAGRGTDIVLGGAPEETIDREAWQVRHAQAIESGGLRVIGTERHESRRIDNQLRGRSGRQGDPGSTRFYLSLEDPLMRVFGSDKMAGVMEKLGLRPGEAIEHPWVARAIENTQRKVEKQNFDIRKDLLDYDNVANEQRRIFYRQRDELLAAPDVSEIVATFRREVVEALVDQHLPPQSIEDEWDASGLERILDEEFQLPLPIREWLETQTRWEGEHVKAAVLEAMERQHNDKLKAVGPGALHRLEKTLLLKVLDEAWLDHLGAMDHLRQGIHWRGYAQRDPKQEYKREAFELFAAMLEDVKQEAVSLLAKVRTPRPEPLENASAPSPESRNEPSRQVHPAGSSARPASASRISEKVGRNAPCPCGSGKKYKQCHGS